MNMMDGNSEVNEMDVRVIRDEHEYQENINRLRDLIHAEPVQGSRQRELIGVLALLIEDYEERMHRVGLPDPIEAIEFRMEQQGLRQRDLVPFIGSRSKVSEVLNRKRPLSLAMIRALNSGLGIPSRVLLQRDDPAITDLNDLDVDEFPLGEMSKRGWIDASQEELEDDPEGILISFLAPLGSMRALAALYRRTNHVRTERPTNRHALAAWTAMIKIKAMDAGPSHELIEPIGIEFMREVARLSIAEQGPKLAQDFLHASGIALVIEPHLPGTYLDGAAILDDPTRPVVGLTIRHDRLDNFWFTLMHELAHVSLHSSGDSMNFYDDLDLVETTDEQELEADSLAGEALTPEAEWERSAASRLTTKEAALHLAERLEIHPAIVAGRMRYEFKSYRILSKLVGYHEVRQCFPQINWDS